MNERWRGTPCHNIFDDQTAQLVSMTHPTSASVWVSINECWMAVKHQNNDELMPSQSCAMKLLNMKK
jgi:hypothetical protein